METFSVLLDICAVRGIHRSPVNFPHKGQWRWALMFSLICAWINGWVNNREAGELRRRRAHYDVNVMFTKYRGKTSVRQGSFHWHLGSNPENRGQMPNGPSKMCMLYLAGKQPPLKLGGNDQSHVIGNLQYIPRNMHTVLLCFALLWLCNRS